MKKCLSFLLSAALLVTVLAGCGGGGQQPAGGEIPSGGETPSGGEAEVLEFYHGYYHAESEWMPAKVMRDIYDDFAAQHADGPVTFKPIAVQNRDDIVKNELAGGSFPDIVDMGQNIPESAITQGLILDLKPFIDQNGLQDAVGINYTQNVVDGAIYTVHDQVETRGLWYNAAVLAAAGCTEEDLSTWEGFAAAMEKVRALGDKYGYAAGQGSFKMLGAALALSDEGRRLIDAPLTADTVNSAAFKDAFLTIAALDQANGSENTVADVGNKMADFNENGMAAVLSNGVWNAGAISDALAGDIQPTIFPGGVAIISAGTGITISAGMSEAKQALALEFLRYMVSPEVQAKIFTQVQANPCNTTVDIGTLAADSGDDIIMKLADACGKANDAPILVKDIQYTWGGDVTNAIINALMECASAGTDLETRFETLQKELLALIG